MGVSHAPNSADHRGRTPALLVGFAGFLGSALAAMFLTASLQTWIAGYLAFWIIIGSIMAVLWPAPVPTRAQVAAVRGEERVVWPAVRARLVPVLSPWVVGPGAFAGVAAAARGWGSGNLQAAVSADDGGLGLGLAVCMFLAPLGVLLFTNVTFPVLYAVHTTGDDRLWALARATGFTGVAGLITCAIFTPDGGSQARGGHVSPVDAARFVGRLMLGDSGTETGWLVPLACLSLPFIALGTWLLIRSEQSGHDDRAVERDDTKPPTLH